MARLLEMGLPTATRENWILIWLTRLTASMVIRGLTSKESVVKSRGQQMDSSHLSPWGKVGAQGEKICPRPSIFLHIKHAGKSSHNCKALEIGIYLL